MGATNIIAQRMGQTPVARAAVAAIGLLVVVGAATKGTWGTGDSITHYLFARWAWQHPILFLDHWAKPVFTLLASPWAQLGFAGMKAYQSLVIGLTAALLWQVQLLRGATMPWLAFGLLLLCPDVIMASQSGLTEPTFGLVLALGVWLLYSGRPMLGAVVLSALPFCRTEGFLLLPVFGLYLITQKNYRHVPLLATATVLFSVLYVATGHGVWHVFTGNPYAVAAMKYGHGSAWHFVVHLPFVLGIPIMVLFWFGLVAAVFIATDRLRTLLLLVLPVVVYMGAHSVFWWQGWFGSAGLSRVLIGIAPLCVLLAADAVVQFYNMAKKVHLGYARWPVGALLAYVLAFPLLPNHAALHRHEFDPDPLQQRMAEAHSTLGHLAANPAIYTDPYWALLTDTDPFAQHHNRMWLPPRTDWQPGTVVVWDRWLGPINCGISYTQLTTDPGLKAISIYGDGGDEPVLALFEVR